MLLYMCVIAFANCQTRDLKEVPLKKIAIKLGLKNENNAKKRKHKCKERLIQLIKEDPDYKIFMKDKKI